MTFVSFKVVFVQICLDEFVLKLKINMCFAKMQNTQLRITNHQQCNVSYTINFITFQHNCNMYLERYLSFILIMKDTYHLVIICLLKGAEILKIQLYADDKKLCSLDAIFVDHLYLFITSSKRSLSNIKIYLGSLNISWLAIPLVISGINSLSEFKNDCEQP